MSKRILACLIIACLCLSLLPTAFAEGNGEWDFDAATGTLLLKGTGTMDELFAVRSSFGFLSTVSMPWRDREHLRSVIISEGITTVSDFAFEGCTALEEVSLPDGLTHIGSMAFNGCSNLRRIVLPASLVSVDSFAFYGCSRLSELVYGGTAEQQAALSIDMYNEPLIAALPKIGAPVTNTPVFDPQRPPVPSVEVPAITCPPVIVIPSIDVPPVAPHIEPPLTPHIELPSGTPTLSGSCGDSVTWSFYDAEGLLLISGSGAMTEYRYSDTRPWEDLADRITSLVVARGVTTIGRYAFQDLEALKSVSLPEGLESISYNAFYDCTSLEALAIPASVTSIDSNAFEDCFALSTITVASGNPSFKAIENVLFSADGETLILFPKNTGGTYTVPSGVKTIGENAFADCNDLNRVILPEGLTLICESAFSFCTALEQVVFPSTLEAIEGFAFSGCYALSELNLPEGFKSLDTWSFYSCDALTTVTLPASLEHVADGSFCSCENLTSIEVARGNPYLRSVDGLLYSADLKILYAIPAGRSGAVTIADGVTFIYEDAARYCSEMTSITLPLSLEEIDTGAFSGCYKLETVRFFGSQSQWNSVKIASSNDYLLDARFEFLG